jgi:hypothetical protein
MDLINAVRNHPRFPIQWPTLYGEDDFIGQGTILDVSLMGGRLAGTMPKLRNNKAVRRFPPSWERGWDRSPVRSR